MNTIHSDFNETDKLIIQIQMFHFDTSVIFNLIEREFSYFVKYATSLLKRIVTKFGLLFSPMHFWAILAQLFFKSFALVMEKMWNHILLEMVMYNLYFNELWMTKLNLEPDVVRRGHEQCIFLRNYE